MAAWMVRLISSGRRAPKYWEMMTVAPEDRPMKNPMMRFRIRFVVPPTAERAAVPTNRPTTTASAVL